jgi:nitric oxide reductase subunit C
VKDPAKAFAASWRKMPRLPVSDAEVEDLLTFFRWVGEVDNGDWPPQDSPSRLTRAEQRTAVGAMVSPGAAVFQTRGCLNCHSLHGKGGTFGPALDSIGRTLAKEDIEHYVENPKSVNPNAMMPPQTELSDREREAVAEFLSGLK